MDLHEYQAKEILNQFEIPIPVYAVAATLEDVKLILEEKKWESAVLKAQVHAGGRKKAGAVKLAKGIQDILKSAEEILGMRIINGQTGPSGVIAQKIIITPILSFEKEYYLGATIDRPNAKACLIASPEGGIEIEKIAETEPDKIRTFPISLQGTLHSFHLVQLVKFMGWEGKTAEQGKLIAQNLARAFVNLDASLLEINPLVKTVEGDLWALDAKLSIDENALFRHKDLISYYDPSQLPPNEVAAKKHDLAYVALEGEIGCMVNGAGLAMATMDIIQYYGGKPANFLDVGGSATEDKVAEGFKIILSDKKVKAILVNIFGGIMNCATLATGIVTAVRALGIRVPLIIRLEGTNVLEGKKILGAAGMNFSIAETLEDAAKQAVEAAATIS